MKRLIAVLFSIVTTLAPLAARANGQFWIEFQAPPPPVTYVHGWGPPHHHPHYAHHYGYGNYRPWHGDPYWHRPPHHWHHHPHGRPPHWQHHAPPPRHFHGGGHHGRH